MTEHFRWEYAIHVTVLVEGTFPITTLLRYNLCITNWSHLKYTTWCVLTDVYPHEITAPIKIQSSFPSWKVSSFAIWYRKHFNANDVPLSMQEHFDLIKTLVVILLAFLVAKMHQAPSTVLRFQPIWYLAEPFTTGPPSPGSCPIPRGGCCVHRPRCARRNQGGKKEPLEDCG